MNRDDGTNIAAPTLAPSLWTAAAALVRDHRRFLITTHVNPDGDAVGSSLALLHWLRAMGKEAHFVSASRLPPTLRFLDPSEETLVIQEEDGPRELPPADAACLLDASNWERADSVGRLLAPLALPTLTIDHHHETREPAGTVRLVDVKAAATGELVFRLIERHGGPWSPAVAEALYVALLTDTGSFRYSNTSPAAHEIAARLLEMGVNPQRLYRRIYEQRTLPQLHLLGEVLAALATEADGRIAHYTITREMLERHGLGRVDLEGVVDFTYLLGSGEIGIQFLETQEGGTRVSLRSKGRYVIGRIAERLGGGGHDHAAGARMDIPPGIVRPRVLAACRAVIDAGPSGARAEERA